MKRDLSAMDGKLFDIVVVGAGIYGACVARDAANRGLSVALIDRGDFGNATSHNSLKLIHGGIRYIQHLDFRRMRQSVNERRVWLTTAPHLVRPLKFVTPTYGHTTRGPEAFWVAMKIHELVGADRNRGVGDDHNIPSGRIISASECLELLPGLPAEGLTGAAVWYDGQMIEANRLLIECVIDTVDSGGHAANYVEACGFLGDDGRVAGAKAVDRVGGDRIEIRGRMTVNTCGPWVNDLQRLGKSFLRDAAPIPMTKSINLVTRPLFPDYATGVVSRRTSDSLVDSGSRMYFSTPWRGYSVIGTTHEPYDGDADGCCVDDIEIQQFIDEFNEAYPPADLSMSDVRYCYYGLTPEEEASGPGERKRARHGLIIDHSRKQGVAGLLSVVGVKYTTARLVARKTVDLAIRKIGVRARPCVTGEKPLPGGNDFCESASAFAEIAHSLPENLRSDSNAREIRQDYGSRWRALLGADVNTKVGSIDSIFRLRSVYAIEHEMATRLEDVVFRRTAVAETGSVEEEGLVWCAAMMRDALGWDETRMKSELESTRRLLGQAHSPIG
jgi:glycerol-3-phosphate dehydrogenase